MDVAELDYELPPELIAQHPAERRDASRLLVYDRATGAVRHRTFAELPDELHGELVVVNDTKVVPARIPIESPRGEVLLLERLDDGTWEALARPTRRLKAGPPLRTGRAARASRRGPLARCGSTASRHGETPLPPYITEPLADPARYQTVYARAAGSAAAPTAGLHFTPELLAQLEPGARHAPRRPRHVPARHRGDARGARDPRRALRGRSRSWERIRAAERVLAVGTTTVRVLETLARGAPLAGRTELFITPGFEFRRVDALLTNFHLPRSTLLALVMAFAGIEETRRLYRLAVEERYRFYSFGDAMLISVRTAERERVAGLLARPRRARARGAARRVRAAPTRIATLLGSRAPRAALVAELGRIREHELHAPPRPASATPRSRTRIHDWFAQRMQRARSRS